MTPPRLQPIDISFDRVSELFLKEIRSGTMTSADVFARAFPHLRERILAEFPAIAMLETSLSKGTTTISKIKVGETVVAGCLIEAEIGQGSMGVVYRAFQTDLDRHVAIKVLRLHGADSSAIADRFELERHAMARLDHPNIVPVYSFGRDFGSYLIMKWIDGHSLHDLQEGNCDYRAQANFSEVRYDWKRLASLALDVASGLQHSHEQGLIHRDIKPGNLLFDKSGKIWITDYGLAKVFDLAKSLSRTGDAIGTPRYMAPEQLRGVCDARCDIYSLGVTLYELASGKKAWENTSLSTLLSKKATLDLPDVRSLNPDVPEGLAKIIMKACAFAPEDRYQTCREFQVVLERFRAGVTPSDRRKGRREADDVFLRKSKQRMTLAASLGAVAVVVAPFLYQSLRSSDVTTTSSQINTPSLVLSNQPTSAVPFQEPLSPPIVSLSSATQDSGTQPNVAPPPARLASTNLLERLADNQDGNLREAVNDFFVESVIEAGKEFHLDHQETSEILDGWNNIVTKYRVGELPQDSVEKFSEGYQESTLPLGTKIITLTRVVERSRMHPSEQQAAFQLLRSFAKAVIHRSIPERDVHFILSRLTKGQRYSLEELRALQVTDNHLRQWLGLVQQRLQFVPESEIRALNIQPELERTIQRIYEDTP